METLSGGKIYERMAKEVLRDCDFTIKNFDTSLFLGKRPMKNIAIIHHTDNVHSSLFLRFAYPFLGKIVFHNLKKFGAIITVSKYWEQYFKNKGYKNVFLIYNAFNEPKFNSGEIEEFKERYNLTKKPIIYLGNCQRAKGVVEAYESLKGLDVHLVTSGKPTVKIPAINLNLSSQDYLKLLKASSIVITMSKFKEGWCRTAHEAMLCKTPVIGSGLGGMKELLEGGKQTVCEDFKFLRKKVEYLSNRPIEREYMGENGYDFAKEFTIEKFNNSWQELIKKII